MSEWVESTDAWMGDCDDYMAEGNERLVVCALLIWFYLLFRWEANGLKLTG